ncbi:RNA polymerase sigma factor [Arenimonas sp.]|uniref:RNA polymerase sigma factor n=1 Tax=Arenimonas sp. TaxID=1872635 RepID=UPI0039C8AD96
MLNHAMTLEPAAVETVFQADADFDLVRAAGRGDSGAFEALYRKHSRRVFGVVWRLSGGQVARAEDLVQEAFVRAWQALPNFRFESAFSTWLHRLAVNTALMEIRSRSGAEDLETGDAALDFVATRDTAGLRTREQLDLERAVATLPERARAVLVLHDIEGWKHEEISIELGMAVGSSKAQLHRARKLLRERLGEDHDRD